MGWKQILVLFNNFKCQKHIYLAATKYEIIFWQFCFCSVFKLEKQEWWQYVLEISVSLMRPTVLQSRYFQPKLRCWNSAWQTATSCGPMTNWADIDRDQKIIFIILMKASPILNVRSFLQVQNFRWPTRTRSWKSFSLRISFNKF